MKLTHRERFDRVMHYGSVDFVPMVMPAVLDDTRARWEREGLPVGTDIQKYFGIPEHPIVNISGNTHLAPWFEERLLLEDDESIVRQDRYGRTTRNLRGKNGVPEFIDYPVKNADDLRRIIDERFDPSRIDERYASDWERQARAAAESNALVMVNAGWYWYTLNCLAGTATASLLLYDALDLVDELFERMNVIALDGIRRAAKLSPLHIICFGEDIAFKNGPFMSPDMNRKLLVPRYRKIMDLARSHGCDIAQFGSDGDFRLLLPDYLAVGVNVVEPCEVAAGMVPAALRKQFGRELRIMGGLDKREIAKGTRAIDAEIDRNRALIEDGGFLPYVDHSFPADISFENFQHYVCSMKRALGIPSHDAQ